METFVVFGLLLAGCLVGAWIVVRTKRHFERDAVPGIAEQVAAFRRMHDSGALTDEEFRAVKRSVGLQRRGVTILEVLFAIIIAAIGLMSVVCILASPGSAELLETPAQSCRCQSSVFQTAWPPKFRACRYFQLRNR